MTIAFIEMQTNAENGDEQSVYRESERQAEMTPAQCRAARGLLDWTQAKLAEAAGIGVTTVIHFERSARIISSPVVHAVQRALESAGVEFIAENGSGEGVRLKKGKLN